MSLPFDASGRWRILALLFVIRCGMGLQFQIVPALSPLYLQSFGITVADLGLLIGLYHAPGIFLAYPSGRLGAQFGDVRTAVAGLVLMAVGSLLMALSSAWHGQLLGRVLAGSGAILMNVMMSKMVTDWFAGRELATAMGIFVNSWPVGIALGLLLYPMLAGMAGLAAVSWVIAVFLLLGAALLLATYVPPPGAVSGVAGPAARRPTGLALAAVLAAGGVWGFYNGALAMVFGFGPLMLTVRGWSLAEAASLTGMTLLLIGLSVPAGGLIADRVGRPLTVLVVGMVLFALALLWSRMSAAPLAPFIALGIVSGVSAGPIMSLPARVLAPETRAIGMGLFFTVFYAGQMVAPWIAGTVATRTHDSGTAMLTGVGLLVAAALCLALFLMLAGQIARGREQTA